MEDLPLGRIGALVPEFAVKDLPLGRTLIMMIFVSQELELKPAGIMGGSPDDVSENLWRKRSERRVGE